jgi:glycerophosphoryl diester phosphodiesterase
MTGQKKVLRIGHRGAAGHAPENTRASIRKAISLGCDLLEVDLRRTRDGYLVLLHDERVDRTTNGRGLVARMGLESVQKFDAGGGERIPTLEELVQVANGRIGLILELKANGIGKQACEVIRRTGFRSSLIYASFTAGDIQDVRQAEAQAATMALIKKLPKDPISYVVNANATHAGLRFDTVSKPLVEAFHSAGLLVFVYTVNKPTDIHRVRSFGVDGIISDFPDRI